MVLPRRFEPLNGQSMAVDETDAQIDAYKAGLAAKSEREERLWRAAFALILIGSALYIAHTVSDEADRTRRHFTQREAPDGR